MAGRRPKPNKLKLLEGNPGKRPLNHDEPEVAPSYPSCPEFLDAEAKREWNRLRAHLIKLEYIGQIDRIGLVLMCQEYAHWVHAERILRDEGVIIKSEKGNMIAHPAVGIKNRSLENIRKLAIEYGLSPASRSKLVVPKKEDDGEMEGILSHVS